MRGSLLAAAALVLAVACVGASQGAVQPSVALATTADEVISRNVAARGGLEAWRKVDTMMWYGHLERSGKAEMHIPFVMQIQRPNRTRFEIKERFDQYTRIFSGDHGWKVRPGNNGQPNVKSFSKEEVAFAKEEFPLDGLLIDYQAKGVKASLDGLDTVDGRKAYRLSLRLATGGERKVWVDVDTNLELRYDRPATSPLAPGKPVSTFYGGYASVDGLQIANAITASASADPAQRAAADRLVIDRIVVNPKFDAQTFLPPPMPMHRGGKIQIPSNGMPSGVRPPGGP
jgi:outer membrane lipoprotein-sorting protein